MTVVVVDDEPDLRAVLRVALRVEGFEVVGEAADGSAGAEEVARTHPDAVVLDVQMPEDGLEFLPEIKRAWPAAHVVLFSVIPSHDLLIQARALGASAVVEKTAGVPALARTLRSLG